MRNYDIISLVTPREVEVENYGVPSMISVTQAKALGIVCHIDGTVVMRLLDFPETHITLWSGEVGLAKQLEGFTRGEALERAVEVLG